MVFVSASDGGTSYAQAPISFSKAVKNPLITVEKGHPLRIELERLAAKHRVSLNVGAESNSLLMIRSYVESGLANCILPRCSVAEKEKVGVLRTCSIVKPNITQRYLVAWPKSRPLIRAGEVSAELLEREFETSYGD